MTTPTHTTSWALPHQRTLDLHPDALPRVLGVLNLTPDSFSDGGRYPSTQHAVDAALHMIDAGVHILDLGGESTRPGAAPVSADDERRRVLPVIEALATRGVPVPLSIDTYKASVARDALAAGASIVNDVTGLSDPDLAHVTARAHAGLILGHIQGDPATMQRDPRYTDVVAQVLETLTATRQRALDAGVSPDLLAVDPGIGFGKTLHHNLALLRELPRLTHLGPVVIGLSRKRLLGQVLDGRPVDQRLHAGLGGAVAAALAGARMIRTHDVLPTLDALRVAWAIHHPPARDPGA